MFNINGEIIKSQSMIVLLNMTYSIKHNVFLCFLSQLGFDDE